MGVDSPTVSLLEVGRSWCRNTGWPKSLGLRKPLFSLVFAMVEFQSHGAQNTPDEESEMMSIKWKQFRD